MHRREFITLAAATGLTAFAPPAQAAYLAIQYVPGLIRDLQSGGGTLIVNFSATWSLTSQIKRDAISQMKQDNPDYSANITFVDVDWDTYGPSEMARRLKVQRHATLIALQGKEEVARLVAEIDERRIKAFLDQTLAAALSR